MAILGVLVDYTVAVCLRSQTSQGCDFHMKIDIKTFFATRFVVYFQSDAITILCASCGLFYAETLDRLGWAWLKLELESSIPRNKVRNE